MQTQCVPKKYLSKSTVNLPIDNSSESSSPSLSSPTLSSPSPVFCKRRVSQMNRSLAATYRTINTDEQIMKKHYQELFWKVKSECLKRNLEDAIKSVDDLRTGLETIESKIEILKEIIIKYRLMID